MNAKHIGTNKKRVRATRDRDIDTTDSPELGAEFWDTAEIVMPQCKEAISMRLDPDIAAYFRTGGRGYSTRINAALRSFMKAHPRTSADAPKRTRAARKR